MVFCDEVREAWLGCEAVILEKLELYLLESIENFFRPRTVVERSPQENR